MTHGCQRLLRIVTALQEPHERIWSLDISILASVGLSLACAVRFTSM